MKTIRLSSPRRGLPPIGEEVIATFRFPWGSETHRGRYVPDGEYRPSDGSTLSFTCSGFIGSDRSLGVRVFDHRHIVFWEPVEANSTPRLPIEAPASASPELVLRRLLLGALVAVCGLLVLSRYIA